MRTLTVRVSAVFRRDDPDAINVLRLAAAANDLDMVARILLWTEEQVPNARRRYAIRMATLHISEILDLVNHRDFTRVVERCTRRQGFGSVVTAAENLRKTINRGPLREVIGRSRNGFGGHYDPELLAMALDKVEPSDLMDLPGGGARHNVVDMLFDISFAELSHARYRRDSIDESYRAALNEILDVHTALVPVIQGLVAGLYAETAGI